MKELIQEYKDWCASNELYLIYSEGNTGSDVTAPKEAIADEVVQRVSEGKTVVIKGIANEPTLDGFFAWHKYIKDV